ncbi:RagB/SusD family nutrient uptake outer membrane protein [Chitinophaga lutea]
MKRNFLCHIAAASLLFSACSNKLEIEPDTLIAPSQVNKNNYPLLINGAKLGLTNNAFYLYYSLPEIMGDDVQTLGYVGYEACNIPQNDNTLQFAYRYPFQCVANANQAISFGTQHAEDPLVRPYLGEAHLVRAYAYMLLNEQFGKVAIMKGGEDPLSLPFREPEEKVKAEIEADLLKAVEFLPDFAGKTLTGSKQAAQLLLARHYLNNGKAKEAGQLAEAVIASGKFSLTNTAYDKIFTYNSQSKEAIFAIAETSSNGVTVYGLPAVFGPAGTGQAGNGNTWIDSNLVKTYEPADTRLAFFLKKKGASITKEVYFLMKFPMEATPAYPVCRFSEAYLISAEAAARQGTVDVTRYNELRVQRKASVRTNADFATPQAFLDAIEIERRREFVGERMRWMDMRRFGKAEPWLSSLQQPKGHVIFPLPERVVFLNGNIKQNDDY